MNPPRDRNTQNEKQLQLYISAVERVPASIVITDSEANIQFVNSACLDVSGYTADELIGRNPRILQSGETPAEAYREMWEVIRAGREWRGRFHNQKKSGELYWESVVITPILSDEGEITNFIAVKEDITRQLEREKELVHAVKMEAAGQLSGGVAHDFNNLLTIINGNLQLLLDHIDRNNEEVSGIVEDALSASADGIDLVRRLLSFSSKKTLNPEQHDINALISQSGRLLNRMLGEGVELVIRESTESINARVDLAQFESALINLCANSQDAMSSHGKITIGARRKMLRRKRSLGPMELWPGRYVVVSVSDNGSGMDRETAIRACEPFYTTKGTGRGSGLGLSMVCSFVIESGGGLEVVTAPGAGATVLMYFPESDSEGEAADSDVPGQHPTRGHETILVVEDEERVRKFTERSLTNLGYTVLDAVNTSSALEILGEHGEIDLLLTDIVMPGEADGLALAKWVSEHCPGVRIVVTTGGVAGSSKADRNSVGKIPLLRKPYSQSDLAAIVRRVLDGVAEDDGTPSAD
ncbi:MAG: PAS domain S-box protein [Woeseiaceae bacterium]